jgi:PEP-CTERM motif
LRAADGIGKNKKRRKVRAEKMKWISKFIGSSSEGAQKSTAGTMRISGILTAAVALTLWVGATNPAHAQTLNSAAVVPIPIGSTFPAYVSPTYNGPFTIGTWASPAPAAWLGTFTLAGPFTDGGGPNGTTTLSFSGLTGDTGNPGKLPVGTYFFISDLDAGSGTENFTLTAYASNNGTGPAITTPWLNGSLGQTGTGSGSGGTVIQQDLPSYSWNSATGLYTLTGTTVPGNPAVLLALYNNTAIGSLVFTRDNSFSGFSLQAVPEPATWALLAGGLGALSFFMRRRSGTAD